MQLVFAVYTDGAEDRGKGLWCTAVYVYNQLMLDAHSNYTHIR